MISPLGQRQILQTAAVEATRQALEGNAQVQQEQARRRAFDAKLEEAQAEVQGLDEKEALRLAENLARRHQQSSSEEEKKQEEDEGAHNQAEDAGPHLDLLA